MTNKQVETLVLFAKNYSITIIAKKLKISRQTVKSRLNRIQKQYPEYFDNALSIRQSYKSIKRGLQRALSEADIEYLFGISKDNCKEIF